MLPSSVYEGFMQDFPEITVNFVPKKAYGVGGMLDFLLTTNAVVPANLPDIVFIDASQIYPLVEKRILTPLEDLLPSGAVEDLFPAAVTANTVRGETYGVGTLLSLEHLAYDPEKISNPPQDWEGVLAGTRIWALPLAAREGEVADAFIVQYLALRGVVRDTQGRPAISQAILARTLEFFSQLKSQGLLPEDALQTDPAQAWQLLDDGEVALAEVTSREVLANPDAPLAYSGVPTGLGNPASIARVWTIAVLTQDPTRREAVSQFINWALGDERLAGWATSTGWLPARRSLLESVVAEDAYREFLAVQLETAYARPALTQEMVWAMHKALDEVLSGLATPQDAARGAANSLTEDNLP